MVDDIIFSTYSNVYLDIQTQSSSAQLDIVFGTFSYEFLTGTQSQPGEINYAFII